MKKLYDEQIISTNQLVSKEIMRYAKKNMDVGYAMGLAFEEKEYSVGTYIGIHKVDMK